MSSHRKSPKGSPRSRIWTTPLLTPCGENYKRDLEFTEGFFGNHGFPAHRLPRGCMERVFSMHWLDPAALRTENIMEQVCSKPLKDDQDLVEHFSFRSRISLGFGIIRGFPGILQNSTWFPDTPKDLGLCRSGRLGATGSPGKPGANIRQVGSDTAQVGLVEKGRVCYRSKRPNVQTRADPIHTTGIPFVFVAIGGLFGLVWLGIGGAGLDTF